jgi:hypothetical protein
MKTFFSLPCANCCIALKTKKDLANGSLYISTIVSDYWKRKSPLSAGFHPPSAIDGFTNGGGAGK